MAIELAQRGYACIVPELPDLQKETAVTRSLPQLKEEHVISDIWNCIRAVDLLESLPQVDGDRLGCLGNDLGAQIALLTAVLDQRLVATLCSGELSVDQFESRGSSSVSTSELIAAISPRSLSWYVPSTLVAPEMEALKRAFAQVSNVVALNSMSQPPELSVGTLTEDSANARMQAFEWMDGNLKRRGFFGRPRQRR